jgi:hypothetical protein
VWLGTYNSRQEATCAYAAAAWKFRRGRDWLKFPKIQSRTDAKFLAPPPLLQSQVHCKWAYWCLNITQADERRMVE